MFADLGVRGRNSLGILTACLAAIVLAAAALIIPPLWLAGMLLAGFFLALLWFGRARIALMALASAYVMLDSFTDAAFIQLSPRVNINLPGSLSLLLLFGFFFYVLTRKTNVLSQPLVKPWLAFLLVIAISLAVTPSLLVSIRELTRLAAIFIVFILATESGSEDQNSHIFAGFLLGMTLIPLSLGFIQWNQKVGLNLNSLLTPGLFRIQGTFWHPTTYASFLQIPILVSLAMLSRTRRRLWAAILMAGISLMVVSLFLTYTRTGWISVAVAVGVYGYLRSRRLLVLGFVLGLIGLAFVPQMLARFENLQTWEWRLDQYRQYWDLFLRKPVTGYGLGVSVDIDVGGFFPPPDLQPVHNDYLRMAVEAGVLGFVAYSTLVALTVRQGWVWYAHANDEWSKDLAAAFFALTIAYAIMAITTNLLRDTAAQWIFWILAGVIGYLGSRRNLLTEAHSARLGIRD